MSVILGHSNVRPSMEVADETAFAGGDLFPLSGNTLLISRFWAEFKLKGSGRRVCSVERKV